MTAADTEKFLDCLEDIESALAEQRPPVVNVTVPPAAVEVSAPPAVVNVSSAPAVVNVEQPKLRTLKMSGTYNGKNVDLTLTMMPV